MLNLLTAHILKQQGYLNCNGQIMLIHFSGVPLFLPYAFVILIFMVKFPKRFDRMVDNIAAAIARRLKGPAAQRVEETRVLIEEESHIFRGALTTMWGEKRLVLLAGTALIVLAFVAEFAVGLFILWGFGYRGSVIDPMLLQSLLKPILSASPTRSAITSAARCVSTVRWKWRFRRGRGCGLAVFTFRTHPDSAMMTSSASVKRAWPSTCGRCC